MDITKKSLIAKRSAFSRHYNACESFLSQVESLEQSDIHISLVERIDVLFAKVESALSRWEEELNSSSSVLDSESFTSENSILDQFSAKLNKLRQRVLGNSTTIHAYLRSSFLSPDPVPSNISSPSKINMALKPEKLMASCNLSEFRSWHTGFNLFFSSNRMDQFPIEEQQGYLRSCLELKLQQMLMTKIENTTPISGNDGCISKLREIFIQHIPLLTRRYNFFKCNQSGSERFSEWYLRLQLEGQEAELSSISEDDLFTMRLVTGTSDHRLREEFLRQAEPSRDHLHRIAMAWESANAVEEAISPKFSSTVVCATSSYKKSKSRDSRSVSPSQIDPTNLEGKCIGCGQHSHARGLSRLHCPAKHATCFKCRKQGHFASVCTGGRVWEGHPRCPTSPPSTTLYSPNSRPLDDSNIGTNCESFSNLKSID